MTLPPFWRRTLLATGLAACALALRPHALPAAQIEATPQCNASAERMDIVLGDNLTADDATLEGILRQVKTELKRHDGIRAGCTASLVQNEILIYLIMDRLSEANDAMVTFREVYYDEAPAGERVVYHQNKGWVLTQMGETQASTIEYVEAAALADDLSPGAASEALFNAALTFSEIGDPTRARAYLEEAEAVALSGEDTPEVRAMLGEIALERAILIQKRATSTEDQMAAAAAARRALSLIGTGDYEVQNAAMANIVIARAALRSGDIASGAAALRTARPLADRAQSYTPYVGMEWWITEGERAELEGQRDAARQAYERATQIAGEARLPGLAIRSLIKLAELSETNGDGTAAERRYREAIDLGETIRQRQGLQDWSLSASERISEPSERLASLLASQGRADEAFQVLDGSRARRLLDLRANLQSRQRLGEAERAQVDSLLDALDDVRLAIPGATVTARSRLDAEATQLQQDIAEASGMELRPPSPIDVQALRDSLGARQQVLVSYLLSDRDSWAFVVRPDTVAAVRLQDGASGEVHKLTTQISAMWNAPADTTSSSGESERLIIDPAFQLSALQGLYEVLVTPIHGMMKEDEALIVIPSAEIATLPFSMLVEPGGATTYEDAPYLIRRRPIAHELAAALLLEPTPEASGDELLVYGRRTFEDRADLPFVGDEVARVKRALPSPTVRMDGSATESDLVDRIAQASLIHLASHADANPEFPLYSQIALSADADGNDDGTLHLYELQNQSLIARLVVLSGCSTARGRTLEGEGMIGLQYAVRAAGAAAALATLWPVDDQATVDIMGRFYEHMGDGMSKDRALQQAQLEYVNSMSGIEASPFYWAPAVLTGGVSPEPWRSGPSGWLWVVLGGACVAGAWVAWQRTHRTPRV